MAGPPDEPPTRRIDPMPPPASAHEREVVTEDPAVSRSAILDELRSLKRAVALIGVLSIAALGVALWALLSAEDGDGRDARGASNERVSDLEQRVERMENDVEDAASDEAVSALRREQEDLDERVGQLAQRAGDGGDDAQQATEELGQQIEALEQRVEDVEQQQAQQPADEGGQSPP